MVKFRYNEPPPIQANDAIFLMLEEQLACPNHPEVRGHLNRLVSTEGVEEAIAKEMMALILAFHIARSDIMERPFDYRNARTRSTPWKETGTRKNPGSCRGPASR
jgi:hypothetical protein